ncbi:ADP,ATP carrier protein [Hirschfeldia incana]|nr:ADP,ATP carrier protein [Hirschfeldia incana]
MGIDDEEDRTNPSSSLPETLKHFHRDLLAGAVMGGVVHTIVAPIERAKLLLQTQESNIAIVGDNSGKQRRFKGMFDFIHRTIREEGVLSLWRGNGSSVLRYYPSVALNFSLKDLYRGLLRNNGNHALSGTLANFIAGSAAGCTALIVVYPLDIAHTRLAADVGNKEARQFRGIRHFLSTVHRKDGVRGIYRGLPASLHGVIVHRGLYFGGFDTVKEVFSEGAKPELALWKRWVLAQGVTTSAGLASYPLDTVRRRIMMQSGIERPMYSSTLDCWRKIYRVEGLASFYRGALSNMFRSTGSAAILVFYDEVKKFLNWGGI